MSALQPVVQKPDCTQLFVKNKNYTPIIISSGKDLGIRCRSDTGDKATIKYINNSYRERDY